VYTVPKGEGSGGNGIKEKEREGMRGEEWEGR